MPRLQDKVAIITGGSGGIGAEATRMFTAEGASVVVADLDEDRGRELVRSVVESGGRAEFFRTDVTSSEDWDALIDFTRGTFQKLDVLINNAGISHLGMTDPTSLDGWNQLMNVNASSIFLGTNAAVPAMTEAGGGSIVNVSSVYGILGSHGHPGYNASKGAVRALTKATAVSQGSRGIRANSVHPGVMPPMRTGGTVDDRILELRAGFAKSTPLGRLGTSADVAGALLFLASDESSYITGAEIVIDGGLMAQ
ncbi:MAG: glucose 1-dehydrogenase [Myxococcales bacterium]|nr:glucose 1-dehydrogenase [Myxococcales bacterium]